MPHDGYHHPNRQFIPFKEDVAVHYEWIGKNQGALNIVFLSLSLDVDIDVDGDVERCRLGQFCVEL